MDSANRNITVQFKQEYFNTRFQYDPLRFQVWEPVTAYIQQKYVAQDARVLDLGAGYCDFINYVKASEKYAVDVFDRLDEYASDDVKTFKRSCNDLSPLGDDSLDVVFASNLFEHLTHDELLETIAEVRRVLRPDGRLILLQPNFKYCYKTYFDDYTHLQVFTHLGMYDLLEPAPWPPAVGPLTRCPEQPHAWSSFRVRHCRASRGQGTLTTSTGDTGGCREHPANAGSPSVGGTQGRT